MVKLTENLCLNKNQLSFIYSHITSAHPAPKFVFQSALTHETTSGPAVAHVLQYVH